MKFRKRSIGRDVQFAEFVQSVLARRNARLIRRIEVPTVQLPTPKRLEVVIQHRRTRPILASQKSILRFLLAILALLILAVTPAMADWPNTNATKFVQFPDTTTNGMDIFLKEFPVVLADDFVCTNTGPISDIHLWLSSLQNAPVTDAQFELSIWTDVPADPATGKLSHPGRRVWNEVFEPGDYAVMSVSTTLNEQFWDLDPVPNFMGPDHTLFLYNFYPKNPYTQLGTSANPVVYWVSVSIVGDNPPQGWKTSTNGLAPDFAVLGHYDATETNVSDWRTLFDPRHPNLGLNFSFALTTTQPTNSQCVENTVKFIQPPATGGGSDLWDSGPWVLADDFICTNTGPITDIHIWGSWLNDLADANTTFWLGLYDDVPAVTNGTFYIPSRPGTNLMWQQYFGPGQYAQLPWASGPAQFLDPGPPAVLGNDTKASYYCFYPSNPPVQLGTATQPKIYWLAVYAQPTPGTANLFGWKSSGLPRQFDISTHVQWPGSAPITAGWKPNYDVNGVGLDLAFKITTKTNDCPPPVVTCGTNKIVECGSAWTFDNPTVVDQCCPAYGLQFFDTTNGVCPKTVTRVFLITDCRGLTATCTQVVTVVDTTAPVLHCAPNKTVECGSTWSFDAPTVSDNCCSNIQPVLLNVVTNSGNCPQVITATWLARDCCGNTNTCSQTITVRDTTPPIITCAPDKTVQCGEAWTFDPPMVSDNCCSNIVPVPINTVTNANSSACRQLISRIWKATDCCGNSSFCTNTVTVVNTTPPVITCPPVKTYECGTSWTWDQPAVDAHCCGTNYTVNTLAVMTNGTPCDQTIARIVMAVDCCGNQSLTCTQYVRIVDTTPPVIHCPTNRLITTCATNAVVTWTATATDNCDLAPTITSTPPSGTAFPTGTTNTVVVTARDACGNTNTCSFLVVVTRPILTMTRSVSGGIVTITYSDGVLQEADNPHGPWTDVPGASPPSYSIPIAHAHKFYRVRCP